MFPMAGMLLGKGLQFGLSQLTKPKTQTTTTGPDPSAQRYIDAQRGMGQAGANQILGQQGSFFMGPETMSIGDQASQFMNPYQQNVIDATGRQFDHLRAGAMTGANQQAMQAGAFGGSRHGVMAGTRLGELDRAQMDITSNMQHQGYQNAMQQGVAYQNQQRDLQQQQMMEPLWRQQQAMGLMNAGMGPTGTQTTAPGGSRIGGAAGGAMAGYGASGNKWGALLGGLGGLFG